MIRFFSTAARKMVMKLAETVGMDPREVVKHLKTWLAEIESMWKYTEKEVDCCTFKELLEWVRDNIDENEHSAAIVIKEEKEGKIILKCCFLDKSEKPQPLLAFEDYYLKVIADSICEDLRNNFVDKDTIVLK